MSFVDLESCFKILIQKTSKLAFDSIKQLTLIQKTLFNRKPLQQAHHQKTPKCSDQRRCCVWIWGER